MVVSPVLPESLDSASLDVEPSPVSRPVLFDSDVSVPSFGPGPHPHANMKASRSVERVLLTMKWVPFITLDNSRFRRKR